MCLLTHCLGISEVDDHWCSNKQMPLLAVISDSTDSSFLLGCSTLLQFRHPKLHRFIQPIEIINLSSAGFSGRVSHDLGNRTSLRYLDLNHKMSLTVYVSDDLYSHIFMTNYNLHVISLHWLSHLSSLQHLDMAGVNLSMATNWLLSINMLPSII
ncbi:putative LRR receptor-like serine/threonine-protein kinase [Cinnamomum micranthum f. kanehirae]|uniref:Putative LRR receptor-like serine/threonine-protein kinase n=1 Tax=Cinnamomum micranthum f. kanehirae TaxID=337451 RepID=A0A3S3MX85_9MAGN|nr:putative LRR receptor-like serine/threonine-protein kinase [Cinnamomum micranthum f. kanehirae]